MNMSGGQLREGDGTFRTLFEESLDAIAVSRRGVHVFINRAYLELFGYGNPQELIGNPITAVLAPSSRDDVAARIERRARGESVPSCYEARGRRKDGSEFDFEVKVSLFDLQGEQHTLVIVRDITKRKQAERELVKRARQQEVVATIGQRALGGSAAMLYHCTALMVQQTLEVSCVGIFEIPSGGRELLLREGIGWAHGEIGKTRLDSTIKLFPGYVLSCKEPVIVRNFTADHRFITPELLRQNGFVSGMALAVHSADQYFGMLAAFSNQPREFSRNDVHFLQAVAYVLAAAVEREKAEAGLREREMLLRRVLDANPNIILVKDCEGTILLANEALARSYGVAVSELVGQPHADLHRRWKMSEQEVAQWLADDAEVIRTRQLLTAVERFTHRDGSVHWYSTRKLPLILGAGQPCVLIVSADVSDQKHAEDQVRQLNVELEQRVQDRTAALAQANKELEAFSYSISHDLRAPLRAIDGFAQLIREDFANELDEEALKLFAVISANARKMGQLIDDLLQFSRLGRTELQSGVVCMRELAESVIEEFRAAEPTRQIGFRVGALPDATGDAAMVRQVLVNLLSNALKFTRGRDVGTQIAIAGQTNGAEATFLVRDNGAGFDMKYAHKLFQVFQRLHRTAEFDGTGVGLAIVQRIVQRHGGRVWAEGKPEQGATFYFTLPAAR